MSDKSTVVTTPLGLTIPPGLKLYHTLQGYEEQISQIAWSPDGQMLASLSDNCAIQLWDAKSGQLYQPFRDLIIGYSMTWSPGGSTLALGSFNNLILLDKMTGKQWELEGHSDVINSVVWSPHGEALASGSDDKTVQLWDTQSRQPLRTLIGHSDVVNSVAWSPNGEILASGSSDETILLWDPQDRQVHKRLKGYSRKVMSVLWSPDGTTIASTSDDETIGLWDASTGRQTRILEAHTGRVVCLSFSFDGRFLASKSQDGTVRLWRCDTWETVAVLSQPPLNWWSPGLTFHPKAPMLATLGKGDTVIHIWDIDRDILLNATPVSPSIYYTNAKVVLVGDTGVGKSGLSLVLTKQPFISTDSTHGRRVWTFDSQDVELTDGCKETHETLLWDLAGQPGYRLIHQLHLNEVALALVVFDARSETDPFAGVHHWDRALRQAQRLQGNSAFPMKKFLVAARIDRGGRPASETRIKSLVAELGFDGYFETSAKEGWGIAELTEVLRKAIDWATFPKVSSTDLFQRIKDFLVAEKKAGQILLTADNLYHAFLNSEKTPVETEGLRAQFETCIGRVESRDLIRRLSFGDFILLQPEILDMYASALINVVKEEPDGLGSIAEERAQSGNFRIPKDERLKNKEQERLLLIAMVEDLLRHEIALRESANDGPYLVFPSQSTREKPDLPDPEGKAVTFRFDGAVLNIYATLAVRLAHSGMFEMKELWKDAVIYTARVGGACGMFLRNIGEGSGELTLFFAKETSEQTCFHFEEYIHAHLQRRAVPESVHRWRIFICPRCKLPLDDERVKLRREKGFDWMLCGLCDVKVSLLDREERLTASHRSLVPEMDIAADTQREREAAASVRQGLQDSIEPRNFDVFLCHNDEDKLGVKKIGKRLKECGILPWLDEWELPPGRPWQRLLEEQIEHVKSAAVFVGKDGIVPWQRQELDALLREFADRGCPVIPVLLEDAPKEPQLPVFLRGMTWIDFHKQDPDPMKQLIWGITGKRV